MCKHEESTIDGDKIFSPLVSTTLVLPVLIRICLDISIIPEYELIMFSILIVTVFFVLERIVDKFFHIRYWSIALFRVVAWMGTCLFFVFATNSRVLYYSFQDFNNYIINDIFKSKQNEMKYIIATLASLITAAVIGMINLRFQKKK